MFQELAGVVVCAIAITGCAQSSAEHPAADEASEPGVTVRVAPAGHRVLAKTVEALGQCEAVVGKLAMLTPALEGHVKAILVEQGASVKADQPIIEIDTRLPAADVAEKMAVRDNASAMLEVLQALPRPEEQRVNQLAIEQAGVALERAQSIWDNLKALAARNEISRQQMLDAEQAVEQARLQKESVEAQFRVSMLGPRQQAVDEAKSRIAIADQAAKTSQVRLDLHTIRAPIDGLLQDVTCHPGQTIPAGTPVGEVVDTGQIYVRAWLPTRSASAVRVGQKATVSWSADGASEYASSIAGSEEQHAGALPAEVVFIGQVVDPQTGNLPVRCLVDNPEGRLAIGQTVSLSITVHAGVEVLSVPSAAIFDLGEGPVLCVVRDGEAIHLHPHLGESHEGWVAVAGTDLEAGEMVIVEGGYNLEDETPVHAEPAEPPEETHEQG
jgi:RND family efflux transporter MFP subunit